MPKKTNTPTEKKYPEGHFIGMWMAIGMPFGIPFAFAFGGPEFIGVGLGMGMCVGLAIGYSIESKYKDRIRVFNSNKDVLCNLLQFVSVSWYSFVDSRTGFSIRLTEEDKVRTKFWIERNGCIERTIEFEEIFDHLTEKEVQFVLYNLDLFMGD